MGHGGLKSPWLLLILLVMGGLVGSLLGATLGTHYPLLKQGFQSIGFAPFTIDLMVIKLTFGVVLQLNVASVIGFLLALFLYFKV